MQLFLLVNITHGLYIQYYNFSILITPTLLIFLHDNTTEIIFRHSINLPITVVFDRTAQKYIFQQVAQVSYLKSTSDKTIPITFY